MSAAESDLILNNFEKAIENHKNNMRNTFNKLKEMEKREKETNGESTSNFIYGNRRDEYLKYFNDEKEEKEREAEELRQLGQYLNDVSLEEGTNNSHLNKHSQDEAKNIAEELNNVTKKINELNDSLTQMK